MNAISNLEQSHAQPESKQSGRVWLEASADLGLKPSSDGSLTSHDSAFRRPLPEASTSLS